MRGPRAAVVAGAERLRQWRFHSNQPLQQQYLLRWSPATATGVAPAVSATTEPAAAAPAGSLDASHSLEVLLPTAAPGLDGDGIAVLRAGQRLDYYSGARWAASVPQMLQTLSVEALRQQRRFALVESDTTPFAADWVLELQLTHFEADYTGAGAPTVRVGLVCTLGRRSGRRAVMTLSIDTQASASADRMQAVVAAFQSAASEALRQIAAVSRPCPYPRRAEISPLLSAACAD